MVFCGASASLRSAAWLLASRQCRRLTRHTGPPLPDNALATYVAPIALLALTDGRTWTMLWMSLETRERAWLERRAGGDGAEPPSC